MELENIEREKISTYFNNWMVPFKIKIESSNGVLYEIVLTNITNGCNISQIMNLNYINSLSDEEVDNFIQFFNTDVKARLRGKYKDKSYYPAGLLVYNTNKTNIINYLGKTTKLKKFLDATGFQEVSEHITIAHGANTSDRQKLFILKTYE